MLKLAHIAVLLGAGLALAGPIRADEDPVAAGPAPVTLTASQKNAGKEALARAAEDPTASLWKLQLNSWETVTFHQLDGTTANSTTVRLGIPFKWAGQNNIFNLSLPFVTDSPKLDTGLSDITVFDLVIFNKPWGRWGFGPVAMFPTGGSTKGAGQYAAGPVIGITFTDREKKLLWGVLNQNLFTYAGDDHRRAVNFSVLQPILNYSLGRGWSVGSSDMSWTYNYELSRWTNRPLGVRVSKVGRFFQRPVQVSLEFERNFSTEKGDPESSIRFNFLFFQRNPFRQAKQ